MKKRCYFDWAATAVPDSVSRSQDDRDWGNPSSLHAEGRAAKNALEDARRRCAAVLNVPAQNLYFTSGGTEANCIALLSNLFRKGTGRIICPDTEHPSVLENVKKLERLGKNTGKIAVDSFGRVGPGQLKDALEKYGDVRFAAIMAVNNETGAVTDMAALRDSVRDGVRDGGRPPVHLHCDLVQAAGKIPMDISLWDIDSGAISGHKIGAPRGIGLLYSRRPLETVCAGGSQENKQRPGTENTSGALALAACLEKRAGGGLAGEYALASARWGRLIEGLKKIERCVLIPQGLSVREASLPTGGGGRPGGRGFSPYILQAAFKGVPGEVMVRALDDLGFAVSTGSACSSSSAQRPVLSAMGVDDATSLESIRISQGWSTGDDDIDLLLDTIGEVLKFL
ncbi:MAG: aminotransferase class V-fold PLP-dependent enzyme [Spirochaetes bacterium]|nr:aminotransferase class V-fold PLP-dependent enzyme [Spirochaetota bacterium]